MRRFFGRDRAPRPVGPLRLHIGSGTESLPGWVNIDNKALPGVDCVLDVRKGLPFDGAASIYAEHFLEHLSIDEGLAFLAECRPSEADALRDCMQLNRAFHGWGHQFLYNRQMLAAALKGVGFATLAFCRYGLSEVPELTGLERHEKWQDSEELPHVLIVEASGRAVPSALPQAELDEYRRDVGVR
jgi:hypothetical protein